MLIDIPRHDPKTHRLSGTNKKHALRLTKKGAFSTVSKSALKDALSRLGECFSTGSLKYEEGTVRTLFASDLMHYMMSAWIITDVEKASFDGNSNTTDLGLRALSEVRTCWDWH